MYDKQHTYTHAHMINWNNNENRTVCASSIIAFSSYHTYVRITQQTIPSSFVTPITYSHAHIHSHIAYRTKPRMRAEGKEYVHICIDEIWKTCTYTQSGYL